MFSGLPPYIKARLGKRWPHASARHCRRAANATEIGEIFHAARRSGRIIGDRILYVRGEIDLARKNLGDRHVEERGWRGSRHLSRGPQGTKSYALIMEDPDAPKPKPVVHWLLF